MAADSHPQPGVFRLAAAVYAQRGGKILLLKRAGGELTNAWYVPGGAVDEGEDPEQAAVRELWEEAGIRPTGPLTLIGAVPMHVYGSQSVQMVYVADGFEGDVRISEEHSAFRWIDPREYRERYFGEEQMAKVSGADPRLAAIVNGVRDNLDAYLAWRDHQFEDIQLRLMGLTADVILVRDGKFLFLRRGPGIGEGWFYLPGGVVDRGEQPAEGALRETEEETGLRPENLELLRLWSWQAQNNRDAYHSTYIGHAPPGEVVLSDEHTEYRWMTPEEYGDMLKPGIEEQVPAFATWFPRVRENMRLAREWMKRKSG